MVNSFEGGKQMKQTIGYIRVSSDKQTVDNQRLAILDYCNKQMAQFDVVREVAAK